MVAAEASGWLPGLTAPVHLVAGSDDRAVDLAFLHRLAGLHDHVTMAVVDGAGHDLPRSHLDVCLETLRRAARRART